MDGCSRALLRMCVQVRARMRARARSHALGHTILFLPHGYGFTCRLPAAARREFDPTLDSPCGLVARFMFVNEPFPSVAKALVIFRTRKFFRTAHEMVDVRIM